jgi:hypothetical protein
MAYLTKGRFGYYINRDFVLPTQTANFILQAAADDAAKKSCTCHGSCGHCGGRKYTRRGLSGLGDDTVFGPPETIDTAALNIDEGFSPDFSTPSFQDLLNNPNSFQDIFTPANPNSGVVFGPPGPGQPGSTASAVPGIASAVGNAIASIFRPSQPTTLSPAQQQLLAQQSSAGLTTPVAGVGLSPLALGGIALGVIVVISLAKSGRRR